MNDNVYNVNNMPLSSDPEILDAQEKILRDEELTFREKLLIRNDYITTTIGNYKLKPDHVYRAINKKTLEIYIKTGFVCGHNENDEYLEEEGNRGVDWYLGGASFRYGNIILECPADKKYFVPATDNGNVTSKNPLVRHMKSSGFKNPVPMSMVRIIEDLSLAIEEKSNLNKEEIDQTKPRNNDFNEKIRQQVNHLDPKKEKDIVDEESKCKEDNKQECEVEKADENFVI